MNIHISQVTTDTDILVKAYRGSLLYCAVGYNTLCNRNNEYIYGAKKVRQAGPASVMTQTSPFYPILYGKQRDLLAETAGS